MKRIYSLRDDGQVEAINPSDLCLGHEEAVNMGFDLERK